MNSIYSLRPHSAVVFEYILLLSTKREGKMMCQCSKITPPCRWSPGCSACRALSTLKEVGGEQIQHVMNLGSHPAFPVERQRQDQSNCVLIRT